MNAKNEKIIQKHGHNPPDKKRMTEKREIDQSEVIIKGNVDYTFLIIVLVLLCFGIVMVFSASYAYALSSKNDSFYFIKRQGAFALAGIAIMVFMSYAANYRLLKKLTLPFYIAVLFCLLLVKAIGLAEGEAQRWLTIPGTPFGFQPSELSKLAIAMILAYYLSNNENMIFNYRRRFGPLYYGIIKPFIIISPALILILIEPHYSCLVILFLVALVMVFAAGCQKRWLITAAIVLLILFLIAILFVDYAKKRVDVFLHPENYSEQDETWQAIQGKNAVGSGGIFGVGLGQSVQKHNFVSQPQNDFIFTILCEELGLVGAIVTITLFLIFVWRGIVIATRAPDKYSKLLVIGIVSKVGIQALLNMAVVTGLLPNTGITLPFFSYGGSAIMILMAEMGIVLSISRYSYKKK